MEPVTAVITLASGVVSLIKRQRAKQQTAVKAMVLEQVYGMINAAADKGNYGDIEKALKAKQIPNELIEYANAVLANKPMVTIQQASVSAGASSRKAYEDLYVKTKIPSVSSGETKEVVKQQTISSIAKQITESPLQLIQKYWYVIPIILIPLILFIRKRK